jgi:hypothetical protein
MKSWHEFSLEEPELAKFGQRLLFQSRIGRAFLATIRKDGAPRLHPISLVIHSDHLYILIPTTSPKCADLLRDGRYAMQSFPFPHDDANQEFYLSGCVENIGNSVTRQKIIDEANIFTEENEVLFELLVDRVMYTKLMNTGEPEEHSVHMKWRATTV